MGLLTKAEFSQLAGVSPPAISKQLREGKLEEENGTGRINTDHPLSRAYLQRVPPQRQSKVFDNASKAIEIIDPSGQSVLSARKKNEVANAIMDVSDERARVQRATAEKIEMQNAVRRSELYESELIDTQLFLYLDRVHSNLDRLSGSTLDDIVRLAIIEGKLLPEHKLKWKNACKSAVHEAKMEIVERLEGIKEAQAKG